MGDYLRDPGVDRLCGRRGGGDISMAKTRSPGMPNGQAITRFLYFVMWAWS